MPASDSVPGPEPGDVASWDDEEWEDEEEWDRDCSPPPGYEDVPLRDILAEAAEQETGQAAEAVPEGFLPRGVRSGTPSPGPAGGFSSAGPLDTAPPELAVIALAEEASGPDFRCPGASADEVIGLVRFWYRDECRAAARRLASIAHFIRLRPAPGHGPRGAAAMPAGWGKFTQDELAAAMADSGRAAEKMLELAHVLATRLVLTWQALFDGKIDLVKAAIIANLTRGLSDADAARAEQLLLEWPGIEDKTPGQLSHRLSRIVTGIDPEAARRRREKAQKRARVELWREDDGTVALCGRDLDPAEALASEQRITAYARQLRAAGVEGTMDQLRARALLDLTGGKDSFPKPENDPEPSGRSGTAAGPSPDGPGDAADASPEAAGHARPGGGSPPGPDPAGRSGGPDAGGPSGGPAGPGGTLAGRPAPGAGAPAAAPVVPAVDGPAALINLTIPLTTLLGLAERPGDLHGLGAIDPDLARIMAAQAGRNPRTTWCVTVTDDQGHPAAHGCAKPARRGRGADGTTATGGSGPPGTWPEGGSGPPGSGPGGGTRPRTPRPGGTTGPPGRRATPAAGGSSSSGGTGPPGTATRDGPVAGFTPDPAHGPPGPDGSGRWRLTTPGPAGRDYTLDISPLAVTGCDHRDESSGYEPSDRLRHLVQIRDGECTFPPCRRHARACDFEHAIPYDQGGRTCACNAGARCRHHHHAKQAPGWRVDQHQPGFHTWTTPSGRQYTSGPFEYPI